MIRKWLKIVSISVLVVIASIFLIPKFAFAAVSPVAEEFQPGVAGVLGVYHSGFPKGATIDAQTGEFEWTPTHDQIGTWVIRFTVTDIHGASAYEDVMFTIYSPGDTNKDMIVDQTDLLAISKHLGESGDPSWVREDTNRDGTINILDIIVVMQELGNYLDPGTIY